jgi:phasin family protein
MFTIPEQFSLMSKAGFKAQLALFTALTNKTFEGVEKIVGLNLNVAKASLEDSGAAAKQFLSVKDAQEWLALTAAQAQPNAEKALAYGRHLAGIASGVQAEFTKAAEAQISETNRKALELVEELSKNAPAGSENAIALVKSAISNANAGYEQLSKTTKQAVETIEANLNTAVSQFAQPVAKAAGRASTKK